MKFQRNSSIYVTKLLFLTIIVFFLSCNNQKSLEIKTVQRENTAEHQIKQENSGEMDDKEFLDVLDKRIKKHGEKSLRETKLNQNDLEIRIWKFFSVNYNQAIIIKENNQKWSADFLPFPQDSQTDSMKLNLREPKSGWETLWDKLKEQNILTIPDDSEVGAVEPFEDSSLLIFEVLKDGKYRSYSFNAPCFSPTQEAKHIMNIISILENEFGLNIHNCANLNQRN